MAEILVNGGNRLQGEIPVSGAKNAALPLMAVTLLTDEPVTLRNCPDLDDIATLSNVLSGHGASVDASRLGLSAAGDAARDSLPTLRMHTPEITSIRAPYELVSQMRASILVLGPLMARMGRAEVSLPGGCAIGSRPVDLHLMGLEALGARIELRDGYVFAETARGGQDRLRGAKITFPKVSVGATENLVMAATLAEGRTELLNAAQEPEVVDLCHCLVTMGAQISGIGTSHLIIDGVERLGGVTHEVVADRIEAGTFAIAAGMTAGELILKNGRLDHLGSLVGVLDEAGIVCSEISGGIHVVSTVERPRAVSVTTQPYPGFPTDLQAQTMSLMVMAEGSAVLTETIFENRYMHVPELIRMGANIDINGRVAVVRGVERLHGAPVMASDLRASASLILAGLVAQGETRLSDIHHLDRGYERIEEKLRGVGASIERLDCAT
ncbi:MAG TPA: UDP-N-acetylglucosamine 1-carboxyvinyltransferase [Alphaproteobacteria bacterium]|nr:UDP-N-acetylglucosamine 1-carboxyvinyltransferase [Alphaproteobacteria bacterium]